MWADRYEYENLCYTRVTTSNHWEPIYLNTPEQKRSIVVHSLTNLSIEITQNSELKAEWTKICLNMWSLVLFVSLILSFFRFFLLFTTNMTIKFVSMPKNDKIGFIITIIKYSKKLNITSKLNFSVKSKQESIFSLKSDFLQIANLVVKLHVRFKSSNLQ